MPRNDDARKHVLVVNDDPAILELFQDLLGEEGYEVTLEKFARETGGILNRIRQLQPDLVIMDFIIGGEAAGWQLLQATQMDRVTRDIPVIVCTGAVKQVAELNTHLERMGVRVVLKPFDIDHLIDVIGTVWEWKSSPIPEVGPTPAEPGSDDANKA